MKKVSKTKKPLTAEQAAPDVAGLVMALQQQVAALERKVDILIAQSVKAPQQERPSAPSPMVQRFNQPQRPGDQRSGAMFTPMRVMHKAVCADCRKECEVPFVPRAERPVYCKECFGKRKAGGAPGKTQVTAGGVSGKAVHDMSAPRERHDAKPREHVPVPAAPAVAESAAEHRKGPQHKQGAMRRFGESRKGAFKKRPVARKRKK